MVGHRNPRLIEFRSLASVPRPGGVVQRRCPEDYAIVIASRCLLTANRTIGTLTKRVRGHSENAILGLPFTNSPKSPRVLQHGRDVMKKRGVVNMVTASALLCSAPLSLDWHSAVNGTRSLTLSSATAAELAIPARRSAHRYAAHYRSRSYDLYCGGPYVGGGWNGGTYWGGPWMELACYGGYVEPAAYGEPVVSVKG